MLPSLFVTLEKCTAVTRALGARANVVMWLCAARPARTARPHDWRLNPSGICSARIANIIIHCPLTVPVCPDADAGAAKLFGGPSQLIRHSVCRAALGRGSDRVTSDRAGVQTSRQGISSGPDAPNFHSTFGGKEMH